jgi:hypothetical protein
MLFAEVSRREAARTAILYASDMIEHAAIFVNSRFGSEGGRIEEGRRAPTGLACAASGSRFATPRGIPIPSCETERDACCCLPLRAKASTRDVVTILQE